jgi:hypothetical protein
MTPRNRNRLIVLLVLVIPVGIFVVSIFYNAFRVPPPSMPTPNGYDDLVKSGEMLATNVIDYTNLNQPDLQALVSENSNALALARAGLQKQCQVSMDDLIGTTNMDWLGSIKDLGVAFAAEGRLEEMEGHTNEAIKSYLDIVHLANESSRGGVLIDELVGLAIEGVGARKLEKLVPQLDAQTCRETAAALETLDSQRQTLDEVMQQEHDWARRTHPGIRHEIERMMERNSLNKIYKASERRFTTQQTATRQLIIDLAARAYELDNGRLPASVNDLAPKYIKTIPEDPLTGTNLDYLPTK